VFQIARTGARWRDLPAGFGRWNTVYRRFRDWAQAGVFDRIFNAVSDDSAMEMAMIDSSIVKVQRHGQDAKGGLSVRL
jgi:transposase